MQNINNLEPVDILLEIIKLSAKCLKLTYKESIKRGFWNLYLLAESRGQGIVLKKKKFRIFLRWKNYIKE